MYADQTAVLGPLATYAEPHAYDLCEAHSERLSAPRGWEVMRLAQDPRSLEPTSDDLLALADAVREAARPAPARAPLGAVDEQGPDDGRERHPPRPPAGRAHHRLTVDRAAPED